MTDKVNILLVDDLPEKLLVLESILAELGENIVTALSGTEALRRVLAQDFAVILLDVNMPDLDGLETAALIRKRKRSAHTPIIFVTAFADELHAARGYSLGAVDYILAPVVPDVVRTKVKVFVELFRMTEQARRQGDERVALAREQAARAAAEEATRRSEFLAQASTALTTSLDSAATQRGLLGVVVPYLADLAAVTVAGEAGQPWRSELAWVFPPEGAVHWGSLSAPAGPADDLRAAVERVLQTGHADLLDQIDVPYPPPGCGGGPGLTHRLGAAIVLPLIARGRILGALTLARGDSGRRCTPAELALADDLAGRAAIALDNARLYEDIQEGDRRKDHFLAMLAHELRNPLAPIRNAVQVMRLLGLEDARLNTARDMIDRQVTHMARLIDDLLDMSRLSRGKILLRKERLELAALVRATVEDHRATLDAAGLTLALDLPAGPLFAHGDPTRLAQIVGNVLHNAAKFTNAGGRVTVRLAADAGAPDAAAAVLSIRDTGVGIDRDLLPRVFEAFSQADSSLDRSRGGLGLGLALVKGLVDLHGGSVAAASAGPNHGTDVTLRLPLLGAPATIPVSSPAPREPAAAGGSRRVLVIEDNRDAAESMRIMLSLAGHQVEVAADGEQGVAAARRFAPQVVVCDIGLPGRLDGYGVARAFRADDQLRATQLVALTGYGQEEHQRRSRAAGFDTHLTKPVDFAELRRALEAAPAPA